MNFSRLLPSLAIAAAMLCAPALAQNTNQPAAPAPSGAPAAPAHPHHLSPIRVALGSLDLSDAQRAQLNTLRGQLKAARENGEPVSRADMLKQLNAILTPAQRTQFQAALEKAKAQQQQEAPAQ
jgi:Spy/CpxP family protein refolding chaperone